MATIRISLLQVTDDSLHSLVKSDSSKDYFITGMVTLLYIHFLENLSSIVLLMLSH